MREIQEDGRSPGGQGFLNELWHSQASLKGGKWLGSEGNGGTESGGSKDRRQKHYVARKCRGHGRTAGGRKVPACGQSS